MILEIVRPRRMRLTQIHCNSRALTLETLLILVNVLLQAPFQDILFA